MKKTEKEKLEELIRELARAYFIDRDYVKLMKHLSLQISWIGTGVNEVCRSMLDATRYLKTEQELYNGNFILSNEWYHVSMITDELACVMATMDVDTDPESGYLLHMPLRFSVIFCRKGSTWKVCHVHNSVPYHNQGDAEFFDRGAARESYTQVEELAAAMAAEQLEATRLEDVLTGILNMEGFTRKVSELRSANPAVRYALMRFGINHFRYINQNYGYKTGDRVLRNIAMNLERSCTELEVCGRIDKDNFAFLAVFQSESRMDERMAWLDKNLLDSNIWEELQMNITFTGGIYLAEAGDTEEIKDCLDKALIAQKSVVRDERQSRYAYFNPSTYEHMIYQARLIEEAPKAMKRGEFKVYVQPQVDLRTGRLVGGEALVRWIKPDGTLVMPGDFIPLFEQSEFVLEFDFYMLELLCQHIRQWLDEGLEVVPVSINQSRRHLDKSNYLKRFCDTVDRYSVPHHLITFELTESAFVEHNNEMLSLAGELHRLGFQLAIDDFGTGYSTLNFLGMVAADIMKIDRSLLADVDTTPRGKIVLKTVVTLAKESKMEVVCEGVETAAQAAYLRELECDVGQGFYFARPMPAEQFKMDILEARPLTMV